MRRKCCNCNTVLGEDIEPLADQRTTHGLCLECLGKAMDLPIIILRRIHSNMYRTFGVLMDQRGPFAVTLEDPWNDNRTDVSCIPVGNYICQRVVSPKFGNTFEVKKVPGRSHILFHVGNTEADTHGCILIGTEFGEIKGERAILKSTVGFKDFMDRLQCKDRFLLKVEE